MTQLYASGTKIYTINVTHTAERKHREYERRVYWRSKLR